VPRFEISNYSEHALAAGEEASAIAYIQIKHGDGQSRWGAGVDTNIGAWSVRAVLSALKPVVSGLTVFLAALNFGYNLSEWRTIICFHGLQWTRTSATPACIRVCAIR